MWQNALFPLEKKGPSVITHYSNATTKSLKNVDNSEIRLFNYTVILYSVLFSRLQFVTLTFLENNPIIKKAFLISGGRFLRLISATDFHEGRR